MQSGANGGCVVAGWPPDRLGLEERVQSESFSFPFVSFKDALIWVIVSLLPLCEFQSVRLWSLGLVVV